jgi:hypothetical protein
VIHPVLSSNVTVRSVSVVSLGPNSDGCDPESSTDVLIEDVLFDTGDDCIAIKSGRNADGRRLAAPSERIVIRNCRMRAGHGGVTIGSEMTGGVRDVFAERNAMSSPDLERGLRIKTNLARGGVVENVFMRDTEIGEVGSAVDIEMDYQHETEDLSQPFVPVVRNVVVERMTVGRAAVALSIVGLEDSPVSGLVIRDSVFRNVVRGTRLVWAGAVLVDNVTIEPAPTPTPVPSASRARLRARSRRRNVPLRLRGGRAQLSVPVGLSGYLISAGTTPGRITGRPSTPTTDPSSASWLAPGGTIASTIGGSSSWSACDVPKRSWLLPGPTGSIIRRFIGSPIRPLSTPRLTSGIRSAPVTTTT